MNVGICVGPTQPYWAARGSERRVVPQQTVNNSWRYCKTVNSKPENKIDLLPWLELEPVTFGTLTQHSNHTAKSQEIIHFHIIVQINFMTVRPLP
jgi:hypothetical protein